MEDPRSLTEEINAALALSGEDESDEFAVTVGRRLLQNSADEWDEA